MYKCVQMNIQDRTKDPSRARSLQDGGVEPFSVSQAYASSGVSLFHVSQTKQELRSIRLPRDSSKHLDTRRWKKAQGKRVMRKVL